jgi:ribokinase
MAEKGIVGFGASNADLKYEVEEIILDGETYIKSFTRASGGSARNTIYAAAMLGLRTGYIGAVGNDENGKFILEELESAGIDIRGIKIFDGLTGQCVAFEGGGNRSMYVDPAANDRLHPSDVNLSYINEFGVLHFSSFLCNQDLGPLDAQIYAAENASPDVISSIAPGGFYCRDIRKRSSEKLYRLIRRMNAFVGNRAEVGYLTGREESNYMAGSREILKILAEEDNKFPSLVICTRGPEGVYAVSKKEEYDIPGIETKKKIGAVGSGDKFIGAFWATYLKKLDKLNGISKEEYIDYCLRNANRLAAKSMETGGYPTIEDL